MCIEIEDFMKFVLDGRLKLFIVDSLDEFFLSVIFDFEFRVLDCFKVKIWVNEYIDFGFFFIVFLEEIKYCLLVVNDNDNFSFCFEYVKLK